MDQQQPVRRTCPWCSVSVADENTHCPACGAKLAQRDSLGELVIPGVTHVDPGLKAYAAQPLHIPGPSPSQYVAGPAVGAAVTSGPAGLIALAGLAAVAATEYMGAKRDYTPEQLAKLGEPSEATLQMLRRLDEEEAGAGRQAPTTSAPDSAAPDSAAPDSAGPPEAPTS